MARTLARCAFVAAAVGCSGGDEVVPIDAPAQVDAPTSTDAPAIDAAAIDSTIDASTIDAPIDAPPPQVCRVSPASLSVDEYATVDAMVWLELPPAGSLGVAIASADPTAATVSPTSLTFTTANFATPQTIHIAGVGDVDTLSEQTTVTCSVVGGDAGTIQVHVIDNSDPFPETSVSNMQVAEGTSATFGVRLQAMPPVAFTFSVTSSNETAATAAPATFTIEPADWSTYHLVTVTAVQDVDVINNAVTMTLTSPGLPTHIVNVTCLDDD